MDLNLSILTLARGLSQHATARQSVLAENVANADTPGYRARDVAPFSAHFEEGALGPLALRTSRSGHVSPDEALRGLRAEEVMTIGAEAPNGNTVSLEDQLLKAAEVQQSHKLALGVYSKSMDILRAVIVRR